MIKMLVPMIVSLLLIGCASNQPLIGKAVNIEKLYLTVEVGGDTLAGGGEGGVGNCGPIPGRDIAELIEKLPKAQAETLVAFFNALRISYKSQGCGETK